MPQLPSGLHVALSIDRFRDLLEGGSFAAHVGFMAEAHGPDDLRPVINVVEFIPRAEGDAGYEGLAALGEPRAANFMLADVGTARCPWPAEDQRFLLRWLQEPRTREWLQTRFEELEQVCARVRPQLPETLKGILD